MNCRKCGAELHPDQKVCIQCGLLTPAGGGFYVEEEHKWRPSRRMIQGAVGVVTAVVLALILYAVLHVTPPEVIAKEWFGKMVGRQVGPAEKCMTPDLKKSLAGTFMDLRALSDEYFSEIDANDATFDVGAPVYDSSRKNADITISLKYAGGEVGRQVRLQMTRIGRKWLVNKIM